ncbi:beta-L-arabinofuranosidase domain-containing protein [Pontibacter sp. G13]|uniref:glycoside hydrolase family 127 protein n=1 Tax=Pontibacter sp. G13 TaxID=3074898 RepID=UPI00288B620A|nr:beta-L-arabinofuranosidase domain-containing protein [Pontibacter sp. G13]WNJ20571.1 glycoside hydrolase family 127 protein [Pontibacter sp. G13]
MFAFSTSSHTKLFPISISDCTWTEGFWADKLKTCEASMIPYMEGLLCGDIGHALNNFKFAAGLEEGEHKGMFWHDGDFYKWVEAATYIYAHNRDENLLARIDEYISIIGQAQEDDGYLQTQIQLRPEVDRYENRKYHEMYNTGHLLIAACVHYHITGQTNFLDIAVKHANLLYTIFFPETKQYGRFGFNQTQIMGLVELFRATKDRKYLHLAERFINRRGKYEVAHHSTTEGYPIGDMVQERIPLREATEAAGHAVLALYYYAGAADVYAETGEQALIDALDRLWNSVTQRKMYVTGAVGQTHYGASSNRDKIEEGFIDDYMMPNMTAYNETCANICNAIFSQKLLEIHGQSKYADIMELVLFNSALSGISVEGKDYFYSNPLRMIHNSRTYKDHESATESPVREPYLDCFCCPPNLVRTIARVSQWAYSLTENGVAVNLFGGNILNTTLKDGSTLRLVQETQYPWDGRISLTIEECRTSPFEILLRIPDWVEGATIALNGEELDESIIAGEFLKLERAWRAGDELTLVLPMPTHLVEGHPRIEEVRNQVAVKKGPIVYCIESPDLPEETSILDVYLESSEELRAVHKSDFLGGVSVVECDILIRKDSQEGMYRKVGRDSWKKVAAQFVPYFAWSNRGQAEMTVFVPVVRN